METRPFLDRVYSVCLFRIFDLITLLIGLEAEQVLFQVGGCCTVKTVREMGNLILLRTQPFGVLGHCRETLRVIASHISNAPNHLPCRLVWEIFSNMIGK